MEIIFALPRYAKRKFQTHLIMSYLFSFAILNHLLLYTRVDIVRLNPTMHEFSTRLTKIRSHAESMFQTLFSLSIRVLPLYFPGLCDYLTTWAWAFEAIVYKSCTHQSTRTVWIFSKKVPT
jgi:hypothetical protein